MFRLSCLIAVFLFAAISVRADAISDCVYAKDADSDTVSCAEVVASDEFSDADKAAVHAQLGNTYSRARDWTNALREFDLGLALNPEMINTFTSRGIALMALGNSEKAIQDFDQSILLDPTYTRAHYSRGNASRRIENYAAAVEDYTKAIELNPQYQRAYNNRGFAYLRLDELDLAIADWNTAMTLADRRTIIKWQKMLKEKGFYHGPIDAIFGWGSKGALTACVKQLVCF